MTPLRVFLDTNVLVSAFATRGLCADVLRHVLAEQVLVVGEVVLGELRRVLTAKLKLPAATVAEIEQFLREYEVIPRPLAPCSLEIRDPDDRWILATAIDGRADLLVSGDQDLLTLAGTAPLRIVDPRGFWTIVRANPPLN